MLTLLESHLVTKSVHISSTTGRRSALSGQQSFSRFVKFQCSNFAVWWVDWNLDLRAVLLGGNNFLDMDAPSFSVDGGDLSWLTLNSVVGAASLDQDGVSLSHWDGSAVPLGSEFLAQVAGHHLSSDAAWGGEVSLSRLSSLAGNTYSKARLKLVSFW